MKKFYFKLFCVRYFQKERNKSFWLVSEKRANAFIFRHSLMYSIDLNTIIVQTADYYFYNIIHSCNHAILIVSTRTIDKIQPIPSILLLLYILLIIIYYIIYINHLHWFCVVFLLFHRFLFTTRLYLLFLYAYLRWKKVFYFSL